MPDRFRLKTVRPAGRIPDLDAGEADLQHPADHVGVGPENRIAMTNRPTYSPTEESNEQIYLFLEHFLKNRAVLRK